MKNRMPTEADRINDLKHEREIRLECLTQLNNKLGRIGWDENDKEVAKAHEEWIAKATPVINRFYKPATL